MAISTGGPDRAEPVGPPPPRPAWPVAVAGDDSRRIDARLSGFEAFFRVEYPRLVTLLVAVTGSRGAAEDLAQEALIRAHARWDQIVRYDKPGAWVRRVALNLASNHGSRRRSEGRALARLRSQRPSEPYAYADDDPVEVDDFWALVRRLPARQAAAIALHHLEDRSVAEVASAMGCSEGTAKTHLRRGRIALAALLQIPEEDR